MWWEYEFTIFSPLLSLLPWFRFWSFHGSITSDTPVVSLSALPGVTSSYCQGPPDCFTCMRAGSQFSATIHYLRMLLVSQQELFFVPNAPSLLIHSTFFFFAVHSLLSSPLPFPPLSVFSSPSIPNR